MPGVLFAVALALPAGIAQAQLSQEPILDPEAVFVFSPGDPQRVIVGEPFSLTLPVATGQIAFFRAAYTLSPLPPGVNFDAGSRRLYGTPTEVGTTRLTYRVEAGFLRLRYYATATFRLVVRPATTVTALNILSTDSLYTQGEVIAVGILFARPVTVRGSPTLSLRFDNRTRRMSHVNPVSSATPSLIFNYTIRSDDEATNGIIIFHTALQLNGGSITDEAGNPADLSLVEHVIFQNPRYKVDGTPPRVTDVTFTTRPPEHIYGDVPRSYLADEEIKVRVDFAEPVTMTGSPSLRLDIGTRRVRARYDAGVHRANNRSVGFTYRVQPGDLDPDGISIAADALASVGTDTITDAAGNPTNGTSLAEHVIRNDPAQKVDAVKPQVTEVSIISRPANGDTYREGETIQLRVVFSEGMLIHPPNFQVAQPITLGLSRVMAEGMISPQSHTYHGDEYHTITEVVFHYTVQADDYDTDGISYLGTPRDGGNIYLGGRADVIFDVAGNSLLRDITDLIITNAGLHKVDGGVPRVTHLGIVSRPDQGDTYRQGEEISVTLTFNRSLVGDPGNLRLTLNLDSGAVVSQSTRPDVVNRNQHVGFTFIVQDGDLDEDGISIGADALSLTGGSVTNQAGRPLILSLAQHTVTHHPAHKVDAAAPKVTNLRIVSTPAQGAVYRLGEMIRVRLTLDQPVMPSGSPILSVPLLIGAVARTLTFDKFRFPVSAIEVAYQVQGGDLDEDGISIGEGGLEVTGGSLADAVGNPLRLSLEGHIITNAPAHQVSAVLRFMDVNSVPDQIYTVGQSVSLTLPQAIGGVAPRRYGLTGNVPPGLVFDADTRTLSGTPSAPMEATELQWTATDAAPSVASLRFQMTIVAAPSFAEPLRLSLRQSESLPVAPAEPIKLPAAKDGAPPIVYTLAGDLPPGLAFDPGTRALSGTPAELGVTTLTYTATDANGASVSGDFEFTVVDAVSPEVTGVSIISTPNQGDTYLLGEQIRMRLDFNEPVFAKVLPKPIPSLNLRIGTETTFMRFPFPADSDEPVMSLEGSYTVQAGDLDEDGIGSILDLAIVGMRVDLTDAAGNPLLLSVAANPDNPQHKVDGVVPKVSFVLVTPQPDNHNTYALGEEIKVVLAFDSHFPVLQGQLSMQLTLDSGGVTAQNSRKHDGIGGHGVGLDFSYVVQAGDLDKNGFSLGANALRLMPGVSVTDESGNPVNLSLADFAFTDDPNYQVDAVAPEVTDVTITSTPKLFGHYRTGERITLRVDFDEPVTLVDDAPVVWMSLGDEPRRVVMEYAAVQPDDTSLLFGYTVQAGDEDNNGVGIGALALRVTSGMVTDIVGNPADLSLTAHAIINDPLHKVDGVGPRVTSVRILSPSSDNPDPSTFKLGEYIRVLVNFNSDLHGDATALRLALGMESGEAILQGRAALNSLRQVIFRHTVQLGDLDEDGISIGADALSVADGGSVTDDLGNSVDLSLAHVAFTDDPTRKVDGVPPDIVAPLPYSTEATATLTPLAATDYDTATSADGTATITHDAPATFPLGTTVITWSATDPAGNEVSATQVVTVEDTTAPVIALTGANPQIIEFGDEYIELEATATDRVDDDLELTGRIVIAGDEVITDRVGEYTVTYDVSDAAGNPAEQKTRTVRVTDTTAPGITAPELYATEAIAEQTPLTANDHYGTATSSDRSARITSTAPATFPLGDTIIIWTATDANGLSSTAEQTITIADTTKPDITAPANVSTEATAPTTPVAVGQAAATDLVDNALEITRNPQTNDFAVGEHTITWKATDASGNFATATQTVTITDTTAPVIALTGANPQIIEFGDEYIELEATATDRVDDDLELTGRIAIAGDEVITDRVGEYTVTYDVSDAAGNPAEQKTRTVRVTDTTAPGITAPELYATEAIAEQTPLTANDHYGTATSSDRSARITSTAPATFPLGDTIIIWTATDANGLSSTAEQTIRITDTTKPDITAPANVSTEATAPTTPVAVGQAAATDLVDNALEITRNPQTNDFAVGEHTITWKATDASGNFATATQTVTITDTTAPEIALTGANPQIIEFGDEYIELEATATDRVDDDLELTGRIVIAGDEVITDRVGEYTVTYDVSDAAGNPAEQKTRTVRVTDTTAPGITAPELYATEAIAEQTPLTANDHYGTATSSDRSARITSTAPATFPLGDTIIIWTATDANGLSSTAEQTIRIADTTKPDITAPANVSKEATGPTTPVAVGQAAATDLVDNALKITRSPETNDFAVGEHAITWKATDASGNEETDTQTITIADTTAPEITLTGAEEQTIEFGDGYAELKATATDLVDGDLTGSIAIAGTVNTDRVGQYTVTYDVSDTAGNAAVQKTRTVIVEDTMKPGITAPEPYATEATATLTPLGRDEYGIATSTDGDITDDAPATFPVGDTIITWTATDANDLISTAEQTITIADTTKPDITAPANVSTEATGPTTSVTVGQAAATDLADNALKITRSPETNDFAVGEHAITWKATDASGNEETDTQTITIADTTAPEITLTGAEEQTIEFGDGYAELKATATDLVDGDLTGSIAIAGTVNTDRVGQYTVTYDVSDTAGNAAVQKTRTVIVEDTMKPGITVPEPYATEATATLTPLGRDEYGIATSTDGDITDDAPATFPVGDTIITWTATDANDLISTAEQTITIADTTKPDITAPANVSTEATGPTTPVAVGQAAATDLADNALKITRSPETNDFAVGEHAITWKATDASGNEETDTQTITIADTTAPEITLTGAEEQTIEFGDGYAELKATATDLVDGDLTGSIAIAGTVNTDRVGQYTVTYDVSDTAGNAAVQKTRTVIVEDTMKPGITVPEPYATEATATLTPLGRDEYGIATSTDGDITDDAPATFPVGDTIITWTATDANGLSSTAEQTITIADTTKPVITAPEDVSKEATGPTTPVTVGQATATDLADNALKITRSPETNDFAVGEHAITWKATDASGNEETDTQTITIADTTAPEITLTGAEEQTIEFGDGYAELKATATDLVDGDLTGSIAIAGTVNTDRVGQYTVTYDVSDAAGNPAEQKTRTVRVTDTTAPGITAPEPYATEAIAEQTPLTANDHYGTATSSDRSARITSTAPATFPLGDTIIIWTATDANGLSSTAEQTITIADTTKPDITAPANVSTEATAPTTPVAVGQATATDLVDNALEITRNPQTNDFAVGEHAITWKATDAIGWMMTRTHRPTATTTAPDITDR